MKYEIKLNHTVTQKYFHHRLPYISLNFHMTTEISNKNIKIYVTNSFQFLFFKISSPDISTFQIWLKDAVQCRQCGLCCHKKCIVKCQMSTGCNPSNRTLKSEVSVSDVLLQPEITMTEVGEEVTDERTCVGALKRVNSVNNLAIPGKRGFVCCVEFGVVCLKLETVVCLKIVDSLSKILTF